MAPMLKEALDRQHDPNLAAYGFVDYYERQTRWFCAANLNPNAMANAIMKETQEGTPRNLLIFPQVCASHTHAHIM